MLILPLGSTYSILLRMLTSSSRHVSPAPRVELLAYGESVKSSRTKLGCKAPIGSSPSVKEVTERVQERYL